MGDKFAKSINMFKKWLIVAIYTWRKTTDCVSLTILTSGPCIITENEEWTLYMAVYGNLLFNHQK